MPFFLVINSKEKLKLADFILVQTIKFLSLLGCLLQVLPVPHNYPVIPCLPVKLTIASEDVFDCVSIFFSIRINSMNGIAPVYDDLRIVHMWEIRYFWSMYLCHARLTPQIIKKGSHCFS